MAEIEKKTAELPLPQSKQPISSKKKKNKKRKKISPVKTLSPNMIRGSEKNRLRKVIADIQMSKLELSETSPDPPVSGIRPDVLELFETFAKINAELDAKWEQLQANRSCSLDESKEVDPEYKWEEPPLSDSDVEREESLKVYVPELPIFVHLDQKCPKLRKIPTEKPGLFIYTGVTCLYWPKLNEIPTKFPDSLKERLREGLEEGDDKNFQLMVDNYEERYKLWHVYGKFKIVADDRDDLEKNFDERLNKLILENSHVYHFVGKNWGYGTLWKRDMSWSAKAQYRSSLDDRALKGAKLWKKPLIRGELKYDKATDRTCYKGSWDDEEDSDFETCPSPQRHWM